MKNILLITVMTIFSQVGVADEIFLESGENIRINNTRVHCEAGSDAIFAVCECSYSVANGRQLLKKVWKDADGDVIDSQFLASFFRQSECLEAAATMAQCR